MAVSWSLPLGNISAVGKRRQTSIMSTWVSAKMGYPQDDVVAEKIID